MIRIGLALLIGMAVALLAVAATGEPGTLSAAWLGWRLDTSAAAGSVLIGVLSLIAVGFWRLVVWIGEAPARAARIRADARRRDAAHALGRAYLALAAGETTEARRLARRAAEAADEAPVLTGLIDAQTAEAVGDIDAARDAYAALQGQPDAQDAARQGLARLSADSGEREAALEQARASEATGRGGAWAWKMLFEDRLNAGDWNGALAMLVGPRAKRVLGPAGADRARAALFAARASLAGADAGPGHRKDALKAAALAPDFTPAAVVAAKLEARAGRQGRAEVVLLRAWSANPEPAVALAYRDLRNNETPRERADRYGRLIARNAADRESRILAVEQAILRGDAKGIDAAEQALGDQPPTARLLDLSARAAWATGRIAEARTLAARAAEAEPEAGWSEIDPQGRSYAYSAQDWARVILAWAVRHVLITPRHERRDPVLTEGRLESDRRVEPPSAYQDNPNAPVIARFPDDPGDWEDGETPEPETPAPAPLSKGALEPATRRGRTRRTPTKR